MDNKEKIRQYILRYDIEVPPERFKEEYEYIRTEMLHRMRYDTLTNGNHHFFAQDELDAMDDEIREAALFEAKEGIVLKAIAKTQNFIITSEEKEAEATAMAERQNSTIEMVRKFFGEDLAMLEGDIKRRKAEEWILNFGYAELQAQNK